MQQTKQKNVTQIVTGIIISSFEPDLSIFAIVTLISQATEVGKEGGSHINYSTVVLYFFHYFRLPHVTADLFINNLECLDLFFKL